MKALATAAPDTVGAPEWRTSIVFDFLLDFHISVLPISAAVDVDATSGIFIAPLLASIEL